MGRVTIFGNSTVLAIGIIGAANNTTTFGRIESSTCKSTLRLKNDPGGIALSINPFNFSWDCKFEGCEFQRGDEIKMTTVTLLFMDITRVRWNLRGCNGSETFFGFALGAGLNGLVWEVE